MSRVVVVPPIHGNAAIKLEKIDAIIANRIDNHGREQYLVRWSGPEAANRRLLSWHTVHELRKGLYRLQVYLEKRRRDEDSLKRKSEGGHERRDSPAERRLLNQDRSSSVNSASSEGSARSIDDEATNLVASYNGEVSRVGDEISITPCKTADSLDTTTLPTEEMISTSRSSRMRQARDAIRTEFMRRLQQIPGPPCTFVNVHDETAPSLNFRFIDDYVLADNVTKLDVSFMTGCERCRPDMGQGIGCEYTKKCDCLEFADIDPARLDEDQKVLYEQGAITDTRGLPKKFPYGSGKKNTGLLEHFYLERRAPIYECNQLCNCGPRCKNRCAQHGRQVRVEVFRTKNRGFGLRTKEPLRRGQFIDTYRGEIVTWEEAERREEEAGVGLDSYQYALDKFTEGNASDLPPEQQPYVVDGETMGGPTRFMNHSCDPNCRQYTVSYNKYDERVYELAFFAYRDIGVNEELTFDYLDKDDEEEADTQQTDAHGMPSSSQQTDSGKERIECKCGARNCRKWLWM